MTSSSLLAALLLSGALQRYESVEPHMGTLFRIELYAENEQQAKAAFAAAFARVTQLDEILSDYKPQSELSQITQRAVGHAEPISHDLYVVLESARHLSEKTEGAFDVTVGPLTHLWRQKRLPDAEALAHCGYRHMHLADGAVSFDIAGMQLDVGGIAKGYAADEALKVLEAHGIHSALVAASGDLAFSDAPPGERGWKIAIDDLKKPLVLHYAAVSTSGAREQNFVSGGVRYSHIIDPRTGLGLTTDITTTVVAKHGIDADGLATALNVLGTKRGAALIRRKRNIGAIIITAQGRIKMVGQITP